MIDSKLNLIAITLIIEFNLLFMITYFPNVDFLINFLTAAKDGRNCTDSLQHCTIISLISGGQLLSGIVGLKITPSLRSMILLIISVRNEQDTWTISVKYQHPIKEIS